MDGEHWTELPRENILRFTKEARSPQAIRRLPRRKESTWKRRAGAPFSRRMISAGHGRRRNPDRQRQRSSGIFSILRREDHCRGRRGLSGSGAAYKNAAISRDAGKTWELRRNCPAGIDRRSGDTTADMVTVGPRVRRECGRLTLELRLASELQAYAFPFLGNAGWAGRPAWIVRISDQTKYLI